LPKAENEDQTRMIKINRETISMDEFFPVTFKQNRRASKAQKDGYLAKEKPMASRHLSLCGYRSPQFHMEKPEVEKILHCANCL
jgi:hypothetical protein